jgi:hypothetical protein
MHKTTYRFFLTSILFILYIPLKAEYPLNNSTTVSRSSKEIKFMVGFKGGITFTQPLVSQKYNVVNQIDNATAISGIKDYNPLYQNIGYQYAFTALYKLTKTLDIRIEPAISNYVYKYRAEYSWTGTGANTDRVDMSIDHRQSLNYVEIPLTLRYLYGSGKMRPFVQGGIFYGFLLNAIKSSQKEETYTNASGTSTLNSSRETGDATPVYVKSRYGFNAGAGIDYDLSAVYLTLDINLNFGINQVINEAGRYSVQQFSGGLYDVQDNMRLLVPSINIGIIFPLKKPARSKVVCEY